MKLCRLVKLCRGTVVLLLKKVQCREVSGAKLYLADNASIETTRTARLTIGKGCHMQRASLIAVRENAELIIGNNVHINRNCSVIARQHIRIGDRVTIGPNTVIYDHDHDMRNRGNFITAPVSIGEETWIGANVVILKGVKVGCHCVIAAGSVVVKDVPDHTVLIQKRTDTHLALK